MAFTPLPHLLGQAIRSNIFSNFKRLYTLKWPTRLSIRPSTNNAMASTCLLISQPPWRPGSRGTCSTPKKVSLVAQTPSSRLLFPLRSRNRIRAACPPLDSYTQRANIAPTSQPPPRGPTGVWPRHGNQSICNRGLSTLNRCYRWPPTHPTRHGWSIILCPCRLVLFSSLVHSGPRPQRRASRTRQALPYSPAPAVCCRLRSSPPQFNS